MQKQARELGYKIVMYKQRLPDGTYTLDPSVAQIVRLDGEE